MKKALSPFFFLILILATACTVAEPATTPRLLVDTPMQTSTFIPLPTNTSIVAPTYTYPTYPSKTSPSSPTATITPLPGLKTEGPYLAYQRRTGEQYEIVLLDIDGLGQQVIPFPEDANMQTKNYGATGYLSPDGKWMAYFSGSAGKCMGNGTENTNDLTLKLLNLKNGQTQLVTRLLSADYPNNFIEAARALGDPKITAADLQNAFVCGIPAGLAWSPDGKKLAFSGQMAGISSDLYVYDLKNGSIQQLSSGPEEILSVKWSADGQWISTTSTFTYGAGVQGTPYRTKADGSAVEKVTETTAPLPDSDLWLNDHQYIRNKSTMGMGSYDLKVVDLKAETTRTVWPGYFSSAAFLPGENWLAFFGTSVTNRPADDPAGFVPAIYLVNLTTYQLTRIEMPVVPKILQYSILPLKMEQGVQFLLKSWDPDPEVFILSTDGKLTATGIHADNFISQSHDKTEWLAINDKMQLFSSEGNLIYQMALPDGMRGGNVFSIVWRPDQSGLFFACSPIVSEDPNLAGIYAVDFHENRIDKVDPSDIAAIYFSYALWIGSAK